MANSDGFSLFGFQIKKKVEQNWSVVPPVSDDGSTVGNTNSSYYGLALDLEGSVKNENDLIRRYREVSSYSDCDSAIEDIVSEAIVADSNKGVISIELEDLQAYDKLKDVIRNEFDAILKLFDFEEKCHDIFRQWYIDGRLFYNVILDPNPKNGILELRYIDPRKIRKIKLVNKQRDPKTGFDIISNVDEYYLFNDKGITESSVSGIKMSIDSVIYVHSGVIDYNTGMVLSYLQKAVKPTNQLKVMEDALVIYRISRAPERRVFYIDVGNLPKLKAEQYVQEQMNRYRNKVVYDANTGMVKDNRQHLSMMEDFWLARRSEGRGTEITTLQGGQHLNEIEDINYFQNKLYQSLSVPISRLQPQQGFSLGHSTEITREEIKFNKFIERLRRKFASIFRDALRIQLITKGIINPDEWDDIAPLIKFDYQTDNHFAELKNSEIMAQRMNMLQQVDPYIGKYFSIQWVRKNVLMQTDEDLEMMNAEMEQEQEIYAQQQQDELDQQQQSPTNGETKQ